MHRFFRYLYLNTYSFLLLICGIIVALIPFYRILKWLIILQVAASLFFVIQAVKLFSAWQDKKIKYKIDLKGRNFLTLLDYTPEFHPETFKIFMQAPCGVLLTKVVLKDLNLKERYSEVKIYKKSFFGLIKDGCINKTQETKIYINKDFK